MRAVMLTEFGPPENLKVTDVPEPEAGPGQVLVEVEIANITFVETQIRAGRAPNPAMVPALPAIMGNGVGGTVQGQQVVTTTGGKNGYSQRAVVPAALPIPVPAGLPLADAVALLADGRTAVALVRAAALRPGETVLVEAAAGGVGSLLVQLARGAGARVVAAAGGPRKVAVASGLGADVTADYTRPGWAAEVGEAVDVVFDGVGGAIARDAFGLLRDGGRMHSYGSASGTFSPVSDEDAARRGIALARGAQVTPEQMRELTVAALEAAAAKRIKPLIGQTFPLERAAAAHAAIEARDTIGKTLLLVRGA